MACIIRILLITILLGIYPVYAGDYHQNDQAHRVVYVITDITGKPVAGETVNFSLERSKDNSFFDWSDNTFKTSGWGQRLYVMSYDTVGEYYYKIITIDSGALISCDYVCYISNDSATYGDRQAEVISYDRLERIVKINR